MSLSPPELHCKLIGRSASANHFRTAALLVLHWLPKGPERETLLREASSTFLIDCLAEPGVNMGLQASIRRELYSRLVELEAWEKWEARLV
jgi:hypothetical protein